MKASLYSTVIRNLNEGQQYTFRITAKNGTGTSRAMEMCDHVLVKEQTAPADADLGGLSQKTVEGKAGSVIIAEVKFKYCNPSFLDLSITMCLVGLILVA